MRRFAALVAVACTLGVFGGCASDGTIVNPFSSTAEAPTTPYYFDEFNDLPIPHDMEAVKSETMITPAGGGEKCGIQRFKGRLDAGSLINTMRSNMSSQGWNLRSMLRAQQSVLTFEKGNRVCTLYISDDTIYTNMRVFMSSRLDGDASGGAYAAPVAPVAPAAGGGTQKLAQ